MANPSKSDRFSRRNDGSPIVTFVSEQSNVGLESIQVFRRALRDGAVSAAAGPKTSRQQLLLTGSITKLDRQKVGSRVKLSCEVNVVVVNRVGGQMQAILSGRASSFTDASRSQEDEKRLLARLIKAATESVMEQLKDNAII